MKATSPASFQDFDHFSAHDLTVVVEIVLKSTYPTNGEVVGGSLAGAGNFHPPEDKSIRIRRIRMFRRRI